MIDYLQEKEGKMRELLKVFLFEALFISIAIVGVVLVVNALAGGGLLMFCLGCSLATGAYVERKALKDEAKDAKTPIPNFFKTLFKVISLAIDNHKTKQQKLEIEAQKKAAEESKKGKKDNAIKENYANQLVKAKINKKPIEKSFASEVVDEAMRNKYVSKTQFADNSNKQEKKSDEEKTL
ncbi:MAG: hypothetical protein WCR30_03200 [Clostridia bacterium]